MTTATGNITLADVRAALADIDPSSTNAGALRAIIGRGSMATIQKHLDTLRAELRPAPAVAPGAAPAPPADVVATLWATAYAAVQVQVIGRLETLAAQRDAAQELAAMQAQDITSLADQVDTLTAAGEALAIEQERALAEAHATTTEATAKAAAQALELVGARAEIEKLRIEGATAAALASRDAQIERQTLQTTVDRLTDQASDLKSLLARLTPSTGIL